MEIRINGKKADITLENEKTIGDVMANLETWLASSGHRLSGISIDGKNNDNRPLVEIFSLQIETVKTLELSTTSLADLYAATLLNLLEDIKEFESLKIEDKNNYFDSWKQRAQALFISEQMPDLFNFFVNLFMYGTMGAESVYAITEERLREVREPYPEFSKLKPLLDETCGRLLDLPLDIQTGKDARASQTIQIFSGVSEKILRILRQFDIQGFLSRNASGAETTDSEKQIIQMIENFGNIVKELLEAYERSDTVLVGDLAEYEASPMLKDLYEVIESSIDIKAGTQWAQI
jgi:hypothetical protein